MSRDDTQYEDLNVRRRLNELESRRESHDQRLRNVEQALVRLADLPAAIDRMSDRLEAVGRLDERVSHLEGSQQNTADALDKIDDQIDAVQIKLAKWGGGLAVVLVVIELLPKILQMVG